MREEKTSLGKCPYCFTEIEFLPKSVLPGVEIPRECYSCGSEYIVVVRRIFETYRTGGSHAVQIRCPKTKVSRYASQR